MAEPEPESETSIEVADAGGSRSPNGQHLFSTHIGGVAVFLPDGGWNPALAVEVLEAGSMTRHPNGAWQAAGWRMRVRGVPPDAPVTMRRVGR